MKSGGDKLVLWAQNKSFDTQPVKMFGNNKFESVQTQLCAMYFLMLNKIYLKNKTTNSYLENITQKTKDPATRTPLKPGGELVYSGRVSSSCSTCGTRRVTPVKKISNKS